MIIMVISGKDEVGFYWVRDINVLFQHSGMKAGFSSPVHQLMQAVGSNL
jgi:hypothetical protein